MHNFKWIEWNTSIQHGALNPHNNTLHVLDEV